MSEEKEDTIFDLIVYACAAFLMIAVGGFIFEFILKM